MMLYLLFVEREKEKKRKKEKQKRNGLGFFSQACLDG
jgi:hypothetical protein